jgi:hypothetical protein
VEGMLQQAGVEPTDENLAKLGFEPEAVAS